MKSLIKCVVSISMLASLTGCASIVNGTKQTVSVHTPPTTGAACSLENDKGKWTIDNTPGSVAVHRSFKDLTVNCEKKGYKPTFKQISSKTKAMAFGNLVFGGVIGAGVDTANGAAFDYPSDILVPMQKA